MMTNDAKAKKVHASTVPASADVAPSPPASGLQFWLLKSEPDVFSWADLKARGAMGEPWTGVRNYLARNNMRAMSVGDLGFFYHSNIGKEIVGVARVIRPAHPDPEDTSGTWECVDVEAVCDLAAPVTLASVKANPDLACMALVTSMRLSVQPVTAAEWAIVCRMGGLDPGRIGKARGSARKGPGSVSGAGRGTVRGTVT